MEVVTNLFLDYFLFRAFVSLLCLCSIPSNFYGNIFKAHAQMKSEMARCGNLNQTTNHFKLIVPAGMQRKEQYVTGPIQVIASPV